MIIPTEKDLQDILVQNTEFQFTQTASLIGLRCIILVEY